MKLQPSALLQRWRSARPARQKWARSLSVPQVFIVLCLVGLGLNGLVQVGLQKDMNKKALQLRQNLAVAQSLSGRMTDGLQGLGDLRDSSEHMAQTLGQSTQNSDQQIKLTRQSAQELLAVLQKINQVNQSTIDDLNRMINDQQAVNADLATMNQKTKLLPQWEGN